MKESSAGIFWAGAPPPSARAGCSVEQDGVGVPVGDLRHVLQDVLLGDDAQQPPAEERRIKTKFRDASREGSAHGLFRSRR